MVWVTLPRLSLPGLLVCVSPLLSSSRVCYEEFSEESGSVTTCSETRVAAAADDGEGDVTLDRPVVLTADGGRRRGKK
ncbi:uncharacterized protein LOC123506870 isoform X2 [Portunus trituberculatus]|uniref:uncharacterized protein LOC123506870 isoform X2 n=1 Tax=Portunus trituberculatus TaxID=210409 RepID=UPI001E1CEE78|nr:uncharacterized protein LOC123506870 isoform X2 [Portunus trituberculatus]